MLGKSQVFEKIMKLLKQKVLVKAWSGEDIQNISTKVKATQAKSDRQ